MKTRIWILFAALAVFTVPSFGQLYQQELRAVDEGTEGGGGWYGTSSYQDGEYVDNPCTSVYDWYWINYSAYVEATQTAAGVDRYKFDESTNVGGAYATSGSSHADVAYASPFELRQYHKMNTSDQFHIVTVIYFDPTWQYTSVGFETACGDGTPSSAQ